MMHVFLFYSVFKEFCNIAGGYILATYQVALFKLLMPATG